MRCLGMALSGLPGCLPQGMPPSPPVFAPPPTPPAADLWLTAGTDLAILLHPLTRLPEEEGTPSLSLCRAAPVRTSLPPWVPSAAGSRGLKTRWRSRAVGVEYWGPSPRSWVEMEMVTLQKQLSWVRSPKQSPRQSLSAARLCGERHQEAGGPGRG